MLTFQRAHDTQDYFVANDVLNNLGVVEQDESLHDVTQPVQVREIFEVLCDGDEGDEVCNVVFAYNHLGHAITTELGGAGALHDIFDER